MRSSFLAVSALGAFLLSPTAWGQISLAHVTSCGPGAFPGTSCTIPATGSGHLIVVGWVGAGTNTATTIKSLTDNAGNTYMEAGAARSIDTGTSSVGDIWYAKNSSSGATSIIITPSATVTNGAAVIWEFSGVDVTAPLDQAAVLNSQAPTVTPSGAAVTTSAASEVVISLVAVAPVVTGIHSGNPFTNDSNLFSNGWAHFLTSSAGTYTAQWDQSPAGTYLASTASFSAAGSGNACDVNHDAKVDVVDVQLATNMNLGSTPCTAPAGLCTANFVQRVLNTVLGQPCVLPMLNVSPSSISFGNVVLGGQSAQTTTIAVAGTGSTTISQANLTGAGFSINGLSLPMTLAAGQSTSMNVAFAPTVVGSVTGAITFVSDALDVPLSVSLSGNGMTNTPHTVSLSWTASTSQNVAGYNVYRGTVSGGPYTKQNSALVAGVSYTDATVQAGQTYYYVATAVDSQNNESAYSNAASAAVPSP